MSFKINLVVRLQHWMDSVPGQTFLNYAYSWGASIVILGTLFKLTHLPGANLMLFLGMGTEVIVFFLSAFDRPFDRSEDGKELPNRYLTDEEIVEQMERSERKINNLASSDINTENIAINEASRNASITSSTNGVKAQTTENIVNLNHLINSEDTTENATKLAEIIRLANDELLRRAQAVLSPEMESATEAYIEKMQNLTNTIEKVEQQSIRLTHDSEEMENLNRTLTGISTVYELQLKSISSQVGTIDKISERTQQMAQQIEDLNKVYDRMIKALTINMRSTDGIMPKE